MQYRPDEIRSLFESMSQEEIDENNKLDHEEHIRQVKEFRAAYRIGECYLCKSPLDSFDESMPCIHWLLQRGKFKKNKFPLVYKLFDYHNIAAFLRWCTNEEVHLKNINDLSREKRAKKVISYTMVWKNIEWTFDCSKSDLEGHKGTFSNFPHYHFQMKVDNRPVIGFGDFHIPFSDRDLFNLSLADEPFFHQSFGAAGSGMEDALSVESENIISMTVPTDESDAQYHLSTIIDASQNPLSAEEIAAIQNEAMHTGKTFAYVAKHRLAGRANVSTVISPNNNIPDISARSEKKR